MSFFIEQLQKIKSIGNEARRVYENEFTPEKI
jgi:hypothetical protein